MRTRVSFPMDVDEILDRIKRFEGITEDKEVADKLLMKPQSLFNAKLARRIPLDILAIYAQEKGILFEWLLTGEGPERLAPLALKEEYQDIRLANMIHLVRKIYKEGKAAKIEAIESLLKALNPEEPKRRGKKI